MIPILFHPEAEYELDQAISYYEDHQVGLGLDFESEVRRGLSYIHDAPDRWPKHKFDIRKFLLNRFPFHLFYLELPDCIWIVAVTHCSRKPNYWKERLKSSPGDK